MILRVFVVAILALAALIVAASWPNVGKYFQQDPTDVPQPIIPKPKKMEIDVSMMNVTPADYVFVEPEIGGGYLITALIFEDKEARLQMYTLATIETVVKTLDEIYNDSTGDTSSHLFPDVGPVVTPVSIMDNPIIGIEFGKPDLQVLLTLLDEKKIPYWIKPTVEELVQN